MNRFFSSIRHGRGSSLVSLFAQKPLLPFNAALPLHRLPQNDGHVRGFSISNLDWRRVSMSRNVNADANGRPNFMQDTENANASNRNYVNAGVNARPYFMQNRENMNSRSLNHVGQNVNANAEAPPNFMQDKEDINFRSKGDSESGWNSRPMDFVRGIVDEDNFMRGATSMFHQYEQDADIVHIKMLRNNTFVTVTDSKGNVKLSGSAGCLKDIKSGGQKFSRYAEEATAEVVGRRARALGLKSVVMKVNGFTHFRRKRQAILSWREGLTADSRGDRSPIVYVEDTTRKPHNGCRLPKKRRI